MMAAIRSAERGAHVTLFEKMPRVGRKLAITGKGRCNLTNIADAAQIVKNIPGNGKFLYSALKNFSSADTVDFFKNLGVVTKVERGGRIFPASDDANEVIDALLRRLAILDVDVRTNSPVTEIFAENKKIRGVQVGGKFFAADAVVLATGGWRRAARHILRRAPRATASSSRGDWVTPSRRFCPRSSRSKRKKTSFAICKAYRCAT